jgi:thiol-disulfide isomerase/thioredoxin
MTNHAKRIVFLLGLYVIVQPVLVSHGKGGAQNVRIQNLREKTLRNLVEERNEKILVLNFWATWCVPCVEEFPELSRIAMQYAGNGVDVVAVSIDDAGDLNTKVIPFINGQSNRIRYFINDFENDERMINAVSKDWSGAIPATVIYNSKGKQIKILLGKQTYTSFKKEIEALLRAKNQ